jgi:hypothetical protein
VLGQQPFNSYENFSPLCSLRLEKGLAHRADCLSGSKLERFVPRFERLSPGLRGSGSGWNGFGNGRNDFCPGRNGVTAGWNRPGRSTNDSRQRSFQESSGTNRAIKLKSSAIPGNKLLFAPTIQCLAHDRLREIAWYHSSREYISRQ